MKIRYIGQNIEIIKSNQGSQILGKESQLSFSVEQVDDFSHLFKFLNEKDRDILYLIFVSGKRQNAVQRILKRSQPSLCYDIRRIHRRLQFICYLYQITDIFFDFLETRKDKYDTEHIEVMILMFYTTSLTQAAHVLKQKQIRVRYKFDKAIKEMEKNKDWDVFEIFTAIRRNLNIVKRVYRSSKG